MSTPATIDLGDGLTTFRTASGEFRADLVEWVRWYSTVAEQYAEKPYELLQAVQARLKELCEVTVNLTVADAFIHNVMLAYGDLKKKQREERTSASSTGSTASD